MPNWNEIFIEIQQQAGIHQAQALQASDLTRKKYLRALFEKTGRNLIAYYSGWLSKPGIALSDINDEDKTGFMTTVHKLDRRLGLDLLLHTPGGGIAATQSICELSAKDVWAGYSGLCSPDRHVCGSNYGLLLQRNLDGETVELGAD